MILVLFYIKRSLEKLKMGYEGGGGVIHATCIKVSKEKSVNITITFNDTSLLLLAQNLI